MYTGHGGVHLKEYGTISIFDGYSVSEYSKWLINKYSGTYFGIQDAVGASEVIAYPDEALNGTPVAVTFEETGPAGTLAGSFNGTTGFIDIYSLGLNALFDPTAFTIILVAKMSTASVWADGVQRTLIGLSSDGSNVWKIYKDAGNNTLSWRCRNGGTTEAHSHTLSTTDWFMVGMSISGPLASNEVKYFVNGEEVGSDGTLGTWAGALDPALCTIGAWDSSPILLHSGLIAHVLLLPAVALPAEILKFASIVGTSDE